MGHWHSVDGGFMLILLICILAVIALYLVFILNEVRSINEQMHYILTTVTNAEITTSSRNSIIREHVKNCNQLIRRNKEIKRRHELNERELHQILTSLTHDLRTPLTVASGYTQLLLQEDDKHDLAIKINNSLDSVSYYLACLTDYNLIQEKKITLSNETINFSQFIMEQLFHYYEEFDRKNVHVHFEITPNIFINSDKIMLKRIVENIVSNLLKYAKGNIDIVLKNKENQIEFICENDYVGEIKDPSLLLMRFQTLDDSRQNKSMGIGLHIIQELTGIINGNFKIEASPSTFKTIITLERA